MVSKEMYDLRCIKNPALKVEGPDMKVPNTQTVRRLRKLKE